jgi:predicted nucleic-acid-binding protein
LIGLDTNVLVRYLVADDEAQASKAVAFVENVVGSGERLYINSVVLCELVWVLESAYHHSRTDIAATLEKLLLTDALEFERRDEVWAALAEYRDERGDFSDYLIGRINASDGCGQTVTFDRALRADLFRIL